MHPFQATYFVLLSATTFLGTAKAQWLLGPTPQQAQNDPFLYRDTWAVLVDDWNNDRKKDLFFANSDGGSQVLLGNDAWRFSLQQVLPTGRAAAAADLDGDGDRDIVLDTGSTRQVYLNYGMGVFTLAAPVVSYPASTSLALGDIDGDGDADLVVGHQGQQNRLYRNNGSAVFTETTQGGLPYFNDATTAVRFVDVDGDGDLDLIEGNYQQPTRLALNNGAGVFLDATATHLPPVSVPVNEIDAGDVDGDGDVDIVVGADYQGLGQTNVLLINDGTGHFTNQTATRLPAWTGISVALVDVDADLDLDLVVPAYLSATQVFRNDGAGYFTNGTASLLPNFTRAGRGIAVGDLDADGRTDVVIACENLGYSPEPRGREELLQNQPSGLVARYSPLHEPWGGMLPSLSLQHINAHVLIDHDHDGDLDLFVGSDFGEQDRSYDNDGKGLFTDVTATRLPLEAGNTVEVAAGDVNGDSYDDLVLTWFNGQQRLWLGSASGGFADATSRMPALVMRAIAVTLGDIDGDNDLDVVFGVDGQSRVFTNNGQGFFTDATQFVLPPMNTTVTAVQLVDLDGDGDRDLLMAEPTTITCHTNNGAGIFASTPIAGLPFHYIGRMVAADFDGDGDNDIFSTSVASYAGEWRLLRNNGNGTFVIGAAVASAGGHESTLNAVDLDGDGDLDIVATSEPNGAIQGINRQFINDGTGSFASTPFPALREYSRAAAVGDVDGDGDPDVVVGNRGWSPNEVYLGQARLFANNTRHVVAENFLRLGTTASIATHARAAGTVSPSLPTFTFAATSLLPQAMPLPPFGNLWLDPLTLVPLSAGATTNGVFVSSLPIPNNASLAGMPIYFQALVEGRTPDNQPELRLTNVTGETILP